MKFENIKLKECPFCGFQPDIEDDDSVYPLNREKDWWRCGCIEAGGGCGNEVTASTPQEAITRWNTRENDPPYFLGVQFNGSSTGVAILQNWNNTGKFYFPEIWTQDMGRSIQVDTPYGTITANTGHFIVKNNIHEFFTYTEEEFNKKFMLHENNVEDNVFSLRAYKHV